jgi:hypothetical protein
LLDSPWISGKPGYPKGFQPETGNHGKKPLKIKAFFSLWQAWRPVKNLDFQAPCGAYKPLKKLDFIG